MLKLLGAVVGLLLATFVSWLIFNGLLYAVCVCLGFVYSLRLSIGLYALCILIRGIFTWEKK